MQTVTDIDATRRAAAKETERRDKASRRAADALLRAHPGAMVFAQTTEGHIVPVPASLGLEGYAVLADEGRTGVDLCVTEDRMTVVNAWIRLKREGVAEARARLRTDPAQWRTVRMLDLRNTHGIVLSVVWASEGPPESDQPELNGRTSTTPRFCSRKQDREGNVIECDEAYLQMFGHASEDEVVGRPTFERVHPDDQARLIESWIAMVATARVQMARVRMMRMDGSWLWVDTSYHNFLGSADDGYVLAECIDVSAEMAAQEALQDRELLLRRLVEEMPDGLFQLDSERRVVFHNARLLEILRAAPVSAEAKSSVSATSTRFDAVLERFTYEGRRAIETVIASAEDGGAAEDVEVEAILASGERRHMLVKVRPLTRETGVVSGVVASVQDVTDSARARRELEERATLDALTGAQNRPSIIAALRAELETSSETGIVYVDLDQFKLVNDTLGHAAGDELLAKVAERVKGAIRANDALGRLGGDEFLILLRGVSGPGVAMDAAERIGRAVCDEYELSSGTRLLSASIGVAYAQTSPGAAKELIESADAAMYRSKGARRGIPVLATTSQNLVLQGSLPAP